eukprot:2988391-Rhodomonas_salina.2
MAVALPGPDLHVGGERNENERGEWKLTFGDRHCRGERSVGDRCPPACMAPVQDVSTAVERRTESAEAGH